MDTAELSKVISFLLNIIFIPLIIALYKGYKSMRLEVTKTSTLLEGITESLSRIEQRQYDRRSENHHVDNDQRVFDRRRK